MIENYTMGPNSTSLFYINFERKLQLSDSRG